MSTPAFDFEKNLADIATAAEKEQAAIDAQEKLAVQMHELHGKYKDEGADPEALNKEFRVMRLEREAKGREQLLHKMEREKREQLAADYSLVKTSKAGQGSDVPMMKLAEALGMLIQSKEGKAGADKLKPEQVDEARKAISAYGVDADEVGATTIRFNFESMVSTRDGNNGSVSFADAEPTVTRASFVDRLAAYGGALNAIGVITTENANAVEWPNVDYLSKLARARLEGANALSEADLAEPDNIVTRPHLIDTGVIPVSNQTLRDIPASVTALVMRQMDRMIGVLINDQLTNGAGNGNGSTQGLVNGAKEGTITQKTGTSPTLTYKDLVAMIFDVNAAYRNQTYGTLEIGDVRAGKVCFMFHDTTLKQLYELLDGESRPLWLPNIRGGMEGTGTILGYEYVINQSMAPFAQNTGAPDAYPILFGNFDYYQARFTSDGSYSETYSDSPYASKQVTGFQRFAEFCGCYIGGFETGNTCEAVTKMGIDGSGD